MNGILTYVKSRYKINRGEDQMMTAQVKKGPKHIMVQVCRSQEKGNDISQGNK